MTFAGISRSLLNYRKLIYILLGLVFVLFGLLDAWGLSSKYLLSTMIFIAINAIVALGLGLLGGVAGQISFGTSAFYAIGAYTSGILSTQYNLSPWLTMAFSAFLAGVVAYIIGRQVLHLHGFVLGVITLAFSWILWRLTGQLTITGGYDGISHIPRFAIGSFVFTDDIHYYFLVLGILAILQIIALNLENSRIGRDFRAMNIYHGGSEVAAMTLGIRLGSTKNLLFVLCAVYAAIGGSLYAHYVSYLSPEPFNIHYNFILYLMVVLGGIRSVWGPMIGASVYWGLKEGITYGMPEGVATAGISAATEIIIFAVLFIGIISFLPQGLVSVPSLLKERHRRKTALRHERALG